jgi:transcriptional regulator with XRE-family HTH domain
MSLSDFIKYQRALKGGLTPWEIAEGSGVPARDVHLLEVKHRRMGDDDAMLDKLAQYFGVPLDALTSRREAYRKRLTFFLEQAVRDNRAVTLRLESGEELTGTIRWYSREAIGMVPDGSESEDDVLVVQRTWVADWRAAGDTAWEVETTLAAIASGEHVPSDDEDDEHDEDDDEEDADD